MKNNPQQPLIPLEQRILPGDYMDAVDSHNTLVRNLKGIASAMISQNYQMVLSLIVQSLPVAHELVVMTARCTEREIGFGDGYTHGRIDAMMGGRRNVAPDHTD